MDFKTVSDFLHFTKAEADSFEVKWADSEATYTESPCILEPDEIRRTFAMLKYKDDLTDDLIETAKKVSAVPELKHFIWHLYYRTFVHPYGGNWIPPYRLPDSVIGRKESGLFNLLTALGSVPLINRAYAELGIPEKYALSHHGWLAGTIDIYRAGHEGDPGHDLRQTGWLRLAIDKKLFRVGRFEFALEKSYSGSLPYIYVNKKTKKLCVLARPDMNFDADWKQCHDENIVHRGYFEDVNGVIKGIRLYYDGTVDPNPCILNESEWEPLCKSPWTAVLGMHIPGGGGHMTPEVVKESFTEAIDFFARYLHRDIALIYCSSWILNPDWQVRMPNSNLAKFQRSVFQVRYPPTRPSENIKGLFFIFGRDVGLDPARIVPANTMQKVMLDVLKEGKMLGGGYMFIPTMCLKDYGHPERF